MPTTRSLVFWVAGNRKTGQSQTYSFTFFATSPSWLDPLVAQRSESVRRAESSPHLDSRGLGSVGGKESRGSAVAGSVLLCPSDVYFWVQ
jgi:hypothetical protein